MNHVTTVRPAKNGTLEESNAFARMGGPDVFVTVSF